MTAYTSTQGARLEIDERSPLAEGGQGRIYRLADQPALIAKLYHENRLPDAGARHKLEWMHSHPPDDPCSGRGHHSFAWPLDLLQDRQGRLVGYLMPYIRSTVKLLEVFNPARRKLKLPGFSWKYLHNVARNLALDLQALHERDYVIGDLNESNVLVKNDTLVTLIDVDSFQVIIPGATQPFLCPVKKDDYLPPELIGIDLSRVARQPSADAFALSVLIFQLLMQGQHPFRGTWNRPGDPPLVTDAILNGWYAFSQNKRTNDHPLTPPRFAPDIHTLHPALAELMQRAFEDELKIPISRPTPAEWSAALERAIEDLVTCSQDASHNYARHIQTCPWCHPVVRIGGLGRTAVTSPPPPPPPPLVAIPSPLDLEVMVVDSQKKVRLRLRNNTSADLMVKFNPNCTWLNLPRLAVRLVANSETSLQVIADTHNLRGSAQGLPYTAQISAQPVSGSYKPLVIPVQLQVGAPAVQIDPPRLEIGPVERGKSYHKTFFVRNSGMGHLAGQVRVTSNSPWLSVSPQIFSKCTPHKPRQFTVTVNGNLLPPLPSNPLIDGLLRVETNAGSLDLPVVTQLAEPQMEVSARGIRFGTLARGERRAFPLFIKNSGSVDLEGTLEHKAFWLEVTPRAFRLPPGATQRVEVMANTAALPARTTSAYADDLHIHSNAGQQALLVSVSVGEAQLEIRPAVLDFGCLGQGDSKVLALTLNNAGSARLYGRLQLPQGAPWLSAAPDKIEVPPGGVAHLQVTADTRLLGKASGTPTQNDGERAYAALLALDTTIGLRSVEVRLAVGSPRLQVEPQRIEFKNITRGATAQAAVQLINCGVGALSGALSSDADWLSVSPVAFHCIPGSPAEAILQVDTNHLPFLAPGETLQATVQMQSNGGQAILPVSVRVETPRLEVHPSALHFPPLVAGQLVTQSLEVRNSGDGELSGSMECPAHWLSLSSRAFRLKSGQSLRLEVTVDGRSLSGSPAGKLYAAALSIRSNGGELDLPLQVTVGEPHLEVDPPSIRFSAGMPGLPARSLLRVRNQGMGTLQGSVSSDAPWLVVETTQFTLSAHSVVTIGLRLEMERLNGSTGYAQVTLHTNAGDQLIPVRVEGRLIPR